MIDALTIKEIENEIKRAGKGDYIALLLLARYRRDTQSIPWRIIINSMNFHYESGPDVDIYVLFLWKISKGRYGRSHLPRGFPMRGLRAGSNLSLIAIEVNGDTPNWGNGVAIDLSRLDAVAAEDRIMEVIYACKEAPGVIQQKNVNYFSNSFRLSQLTSYLSENGWSIISGFAGVGALLISP